MSYLLAKHKATGSAVDSTATMVRLQASQILVKLVNFYFIFLYYLAGSLEQVAQWR